MKKEYIILIAIIIGLTAYLALKKDDRVHYQLPALDQVDTTAVDQVIISKGEKTTTLSRTDKAWTVTKEAYPVAQSAVDDILDTIKDLRLSALVSESGDLVRYELGPDKALHVKALSKGNLVREFFIGKTAPSFNHTFVMLRDDKRVFQADSSFRSQFDKSVDEFRDKVVLSFKTGEIQKLTLEKDGISRTLTLKAPEAKAEDAKGEKPTGGKAEPLWMTPDGKAAAGQTAIQDLLASLSRLECQGFKDDAQTQALKSKAPACKIMLENGKAHGVNLYSSKEGEDVAGTSSATPYAFDLASYKAGDILSYVDKILGIEAKDKESK